jgi:hypothetical protein
MHQIAAQYRGRCADQERRVGRAAEDVHAGQQFEQHAKRRRIAAERVDDQNKERERKETDLARPGEAARKPKDKDRQHRQRAVIDLAHVRRQEQVLWIPRLAVRPPIRHRVIGAEQAADQHGEQRGRMERALRRLGVMKRRAVARLREEEREQNRHRHDEQARDRRRDERPRRAAQRLIQRRLRQPVVGNEADQEQRAEERNLVRLHQHQSGRDAGKQAIEQRRAIERAREQPQRDCKEHQALDLPDVLDAPRGRRAECEGERRHDAAGRMPAAIAKEHQHREPRAGEQRQHGDIERMEARMRRQQREQNHRREDQRLRIGDLRHAAEHVRRPERRLALMDRVGEELQLGLEQRLGVIGNRHGPREPGPAQRRPCQQEQRDRKRSRPPLQVHPDSPLESYFFWKSYGGTFI